MTKEQFLQLSRSQQEEFINDGGVFEEEKQSPAAPEEVHDSPPSVECGVAQVETEECPANTPLVKDEGSSPSTSPQPVPDSLAPEAEPYVDGFDIQDPVELLFLIDDDIASGKVSLHKWQVQFMLDFANENHTKDNPFQAVVRACNGSGKDKYIVAACVVWLCMRYTLARGVVTNGSGVQLDNQTETYIRHLCERVNAKFAGGKQVIWKCNYRFYECLPTQSPIVLFATDEPLKAEGYHPLKAGGRMGIFTSESKSIPDGIFGGLSRCTGFTHRVDVSTPGKRMGYFFERDSVSLSREELDDLKEAAAAQSVRYLVTAFDCPHITPSEIEIFAASLPGGKDSPVYKSGILTEFIDGDGELLVIPYSYVYYAVKKKTPDQWKPENVNKAGVDLSDGGDETVLVIRNGNRVIKVIPFRFDNTEDTVAFLDEKFKEYHLDNPDSRIFGDCGGLGKPILDRLKRMGWKNIRYCDNRAKSSRPKIYRNFGAQSWFHFGELLKRKEILLVDDEKLIKQLATRYYKIMDGAIHQLLSKIEMRARGYPSPDRADAVVLAFTDYKSDFVEVPEDNKPPYKEEEEKKEKVVGAFTLQSFARGKEPKVLGRYTVNNGARDFSDLQEEIADYNRKLLVEKG